MCAEMEKEMQKCIKVKLDLLKVSRCIDYCQTAKEKDFYQNIALEYSIELKRIYSFLEDMYDLKICVCCKL